MNGWRMVIGLIQLPYGVREVSTVRTWTWGSGALGCEGEHCRGHGITDGRQQLRFLSTQTLPLRAGGAGSAGRVLF
ncbi:unnamed protein product [Gadus morhua 'NCC']